MLKNASLKSIRKEAIDVLNKNWVGKYTRPAPRLYPHQWNWDSVFHAIGWSHVDESRAWMEIESLLRGQWTSGMLPHIIFNERADYHPGPEYWNSSISGMAPDDFHTSGITQPPLLAYGVWELYQRAADRQSAVQRLREWYAQIKAYHAFLHDARDMDGSGLAAIIHPWESGQDNSPRWDAALERIELSWRPVYRRVDNEIVPKEERPTDDAYDRYSYLVDVFREIAYKPSRLWKESPFLIQPVMFNSILLASERCLRNVAEVLEGDTEEIDGWIDRLEDGFRDKLWDERERFYFDYDLRAGERIVVQALTGFLTLFAGVPDANVAKTMVEDLMNGRTYLLERGYPFCTVSMEEPAFNPQNYWRGPAWVNMNWFIIRSLLDYGYRDEAAQIAERTVQLVADHGFHEYFHPETGRGCGSDAFSWTASLILDLIESFHLND